MEHKIYLAPPAKSSSSTIPIQEMVSLSNQVLYVLVV